jgi:hypothetical protein
MDRIPDIYFRELARKLTHAEFVLLGQVLNETCGAARAPWATMDDQRLAECFGLDPATVQAVLEGLQREGYLHARYVPDFGFQYQPSDFFGQLPEPDPMHDCQHHGPYPEPLRSCPGCAADVRELLMYLVTSPDPAARQIAREALALFPAVPLPFPQPIFRNGAGPRPASPPWSSHELPVEVL